MAEMRERVVKLEERTTMHSDKLREANVNIGKVLDTLEIIQRDLHGAKLAGRFGLGLVLTAGGLLGFLIKLVVK